MYIHVYMIEWESNPGLLTCTSKSDYLTLQQ